MSYNNWLYGYANPVKYVDPTGLFTCDTCVYFRSEAGRKWCEKNCCGRRWGDILQPPTPTPIILPNIRIVFGGSDPSKGITHPGPEPHIQIPVWNEIGDIVKKYEGSKLDQSLSVAIKPLMDKNVQVIGYSAGADSALLFSHRYFEAQRRSGFPGRITDIAMLGGTMSGGLEGVWKKYLNDLLLWGTDIYILDDSAEYGGEASGYSAPKKAPGTFHFESHQDQQHWDGPFDGTYSDLSVGTNNSPRFREEVLNWFEKY